MLDNCKPVHPPDRETVEVKQRTGPPAAVSVLLVSLVMMVAVGARLLLLGQVTPRSELEVLP
jgi:hypothetical protein